MVRVWRSGTVCPQAGQLRRTVPHQEKQKEMNVVCGRGVQPGAGEGDLEPFKAN